MSFEPRSPFFKQGIEAYSANKNEGRPNFFHLLNIYFIFTRYEKNSFTLPTPCDRKFIKGPSLWSLLWHQFIRLQIQLI